MKCKRVSFYATEKFIETFLDADGEMEIVDNDGDSFSPVPTIEDAEAHVSDVWVAADEDIPDEEEESDDSEDSEEPEEE